MDHQEASRQRLSSIADKVIRRHQLDWQAIFKARPDLEPPGYHEAVVATKTKVQERKMLQKNPPKERGKKKK